MRWMLMPFRRYFDFSGRSCRKEFWSFFLLQFFALAALTFWIFRIFVAIGREGDTGHVVDDTAGHIDIGLTLFGIFLLATFIPSIAVQVRRFHDQDKSGLLVLLNLLPGVGGLIVLVLMCLEGTKGDNRFGPDPSAASA
jgi:uncharacterized membrane protein YhaH (DUF805 family)